MTATQTQIRRGTSAQVAAMTPVDGEVVYNTTDDRLHAGNGSTAGGIPHANLKDVQNSVFTYGTVGGTADAITITHAFPVTAYTNGLGIKFKATGTNTTAATVNVDGLGVKNIYKMSGTTLAAVVANDIVSGGIYDLHYDGTQFQLGSGGGGGGVSDNQVFTSSSTWNKPSGFSTTARVLIECWGAGGGGSGDSNGGGGNGGNGGDTTFGTLVTAYGGQGGVISTNGGNGGSHFTSAATSNRMGVEGLGSGLTSVTLGNNAPISTASGGTMTFANCQNSFYGGGGGGCSASPMNSDGGRSVWGGGGGGAYSGLGAIGSGAGGVSQYGGNGGAATAAGSAPGGGGGGRGTTAGSMGGGGGAYKYRWVALSALGATETVTIGAAGAAAGGGSGAGARGECRVTVFG